MTRYESTELRDTALEMLHVQDFYTLRNELADLTLDLAGEAKRMKHSRGKSIILYNIERLVVKGRLPGVYQEPSIDTSQHPRAPSQAPKS